MARCVKLDLVHPLSIEQSVDSLPDVLPQWEFDLLLFEWQRIAAMAWGGYLTAGEGFVEINVEEDEPRFAYHAGHPCDCHRGLVEEYDPEQHVVVRVAFGQTDHLHNLAGWPTPIEAFRCVTAAAVDAAVH